MITLKKDTTVLLVNALCLLLVFGLVYAGRVTWTQAEAFILGLVVPSGLGWRKTQASS